MSVFISAHPKILKAGGRYYTIDEYQLLVSMLRGGQPLVVIVVVKTNPVGEQTCGDRTTTRIHRGRLPTHQQTALGKSV